MKLLTYQVPAFIFLVVFGVSAISAAADPHALPTRFHAEPALSLPDDASDALIKAAFELYKQKKYEEALANCTKAAAINPKDFRSRFIAGLVYLAQWKLKSASEAFAQATLLRPDHKESYLLKARADRYRNAKEEALAAGRKALEIDPKYAEAYAMVGEILAIGDERDDEAIESYRTAIKIMPGLLTAYGPLGELLAAAKDLKGAEEVLRKGMEVDPKRMAGRFQLGRLLVEQGRLKEARELWEGRTTDVENTYPNFITVLERAEQLKRATDALDRNPNDPETLLQMGNAVMEGDSWVVDGRQERAIAYFRKALEIKPGLAKAQYAICKAFIQTADISKDKNKNVDEELAKLRQLDPKLADEMEAYRKSYSGALRGTWGDPNQ